jgi:hypothetical protein
VSRPAPEHLGPQAGLAGTRDWDPVCIEPRYYVLGQTDAGRKLFVVVTVRRELIRVISARDMNRRERKEYEDAGKGAEGDTEV